MMLAKHKRRRLVYYHRFRAKKIRLGACMQCARRVFPGRRKCLVHIMKGWLKGRLCLLCKKPLLQEVRASRLIRSHPKCQVERRRLMARLNWARNKRTPGYIKAHRKAVKRWQAKQKKLGLCEICHRKARASRCQIHMK